MAVQEKGLRFVAVLIEELNVIVRVSTLARKYRGGLRQYRRDFLGFGFCCDGLITRVGAGSGSDLDVLTDSLREKGLVLATEFGYADIAVVDEFRGLTVGCFWLETGRGPKGFGYAFTPGTDPSVLIAVPSGWSLGGRDARRIGRSAGEPLSQLLFLRSDGATNVFLNRQTGQEVRISSQNPGLGDRVIN